VDRLIDTSRAARLAGVTRGEIERHIASGTLSSFEGKVNMRDLLKIYPEIDDSGRYMFEVVSQIKEDAVGKAIRRRGGEEVQDPAALRREIASLRREAGYYKDRCEKYKQVLTELRPKLIELQKTSEQKSRFGALIAWLTHKTQEVW
jgi:CDP-4-dehydro-6-deoxyglucose reductase, E3